MTSNKRKITIFGAGGATGRALVDRAIDTQLHVEAVEHSWPADAADAQNVFHRTADVMKDDLTDIVSGSDYVFSAIGLGFSPVTVFDPPPLYTAGTLNIMKAMDRAEIRRLIVISAAFVDPDFSTPFWFRATAQRALLNVYKQMADMERILEASAQIEWTAVRPGWLLDEPRTEDYQVFSDRLPGPMLRTRHADLADFMLRCATEGKFAKAKPAVGRREGLQHENPLAFIREFV